MLALHKKYGKIAKVGGLIGHPDLLFIYDGDEIRKVFQREEIQPHRYRITSQYVFKLTPPIFLFCVCGCCLLSPYRLNFNAIFVYNVIHRCLFFFPFSVPPCPPFTTTRRRYARTFSEKWPESSGCK